MIPSARQPRLTSFCDFDESCGTWDTSLNIFKTKSQKRRYNRSERPEFDARGGSLEFTQLLDGCISKHAVNVGDTFLAHAALLTPLPYFEIRTVLVAPSSP